MLSKNQEWKQSGSNQSFKDWLRTDLNADVQQTVSVVNDDVEVKEGEPFANQTGVNPNCNYQPTLKGNTIFGINKLVVYTVMGLAAAGIIIGIANHDIKNYAK